MNFSLGYLRVAVGLAMAASLSAQAAGWDAAADFTTATTTNPNGVWSYGYDPAGVVGYQFKAFDQLSAGSFLAWTDSTYVSLGTPTFEKNLGGSSVVGVLPGQVALHPGPTPDGDAAILRFTAPSAGAYRVAAQFFAGDSSETDAWIVKNDDFSTPLLTVGITSTNPAVSLTGLALGAGETLDFVVGNHGSYFYDTTPLSVQISPVPELPTLPLLAAGLAVVGLRRRTAR